ncbi:MAG TPA: histidine kinase [Streptosporangiaceae bacterium]|nr:histidine kinase [Streptosporangiaceae bacterium]
MRVSRRVAALDPGKVLDTGLAAGGAALVAIAAWVPQGPAGLAITGPPWLRAGLPLLIGGPLAVRRRRPLLTWALIWTGVSVQALVTGNAPTTVALTVVLFAGGYALGAYSPPWRAVAGLGIMAIGAAIYVAIGHGGTGSPDVFGGYEFVERASPNTVFLAEVLALWLIGVFVRTRRQSAALAARNTEQDRQAERAVAAERARIAREMHDIVAHHLSVVVLQAAGSRRSGQPSLAALEKIENSGRQALTETRRLLRLLREPEESAAVVPQPGIGALAELADSVRSAGLPVCLVVDGDHAMLPAAMEVSVYRIVQEALTNVLKHAGPARARVAVDCAGDAVTIEVTDDGAGYSVPGGQHQAGQHGLAGMRERVAVFGGELRAGPEPGGGFAVRATLPLHDRPVLEGRSA